MINIKKLFYRINKSKFASQFKILALGTLISQIILISSTPLITRLYNPEVFGIFALFTSLISVFDPIVCGRYNIAMIVVKKNNEGNALLKLSLILSLVFCLLLLIIFFFGEIPLKKLLNAEKLNFWWFLIPVIIFLSSCREIIKSYLNRVKNYSLISKSEIFFSFINVTFLLSLGYLGYTFNGIFMANMISYTATIIFLFFLIKKIKKKIFLIKNKKLHEVAKKYKEFPIYQSTSTLINTIRVALPVFFLTKYFNSDIVGYYSLILMSIFYPLSFISKSIAMVHIRKVTELIQTRSNVTNYMKKLTFILISIFLVPVFIVLFFGPEIFSFVFGQQWIIAGNLASILIIGLGFQFVISTLSPVFSSTGHLKISSLWNLGSFIFSLSLMLYFIPKLNIEGVMYLFLWINIVIYSIYYFLIIFVINNPKKI
jgi:O-antigen/teichoic acid export membrane protein